MEEVLENICGARNILSCAAKTCFKKQIRHNQSAQRILQHRFCQFFYCIARGERGTIRYFLLPQSKDYYDFYCGTLAEFAALLKQWMTEDGLSGPFCHNFANPGMNAMLLETVDAMGNGFLPGSDHYFRLNPMEVKALDVSVL